MGKVTEDDRQFKEYMGGFFHEMLRAAGVTMVQGNSFERIRSIGERTASAIEHAAERKSVQVIKKLQEAVKLAFGRTEERIVQLEKEVAELKAAKITKPFHRAPSGPEDL
jgi:hypothetical protein